MVNDYAFGGLFIAIALLAVKIGDPWTSCIASLFAIYFLGNMFRRLL